MTDFQTVIDMWINHPVLAVQTKELWPALGEVMDRLADEEENEGEI